MNCGNYTLINSSDAAASSGTIYKVTDFYNTSKTDTSSLLYITVQKSGTASNDFSTATTSSEAGLYKSLDDLGTSYYFRGATNNNYVKFGTRKQYKGCLNSDCSEFSEQLYTDKSICEVAVEYGTYTSCEIESEEPMYWRIVRINGDGTIRMIYDGIEKAENGTSHTATIGSSKYNSSGSSGGEKYAGYTFTNDAGTETDSTIKGVIDAWYDTNLKGTYESYIADGIFCNDKQLSYSDSYGHLYYKSYDRLKTFKTPILTCTNTEDRYSVSSKMGNGKLKYPIGLITADEIVMAGMGASVNTSFYLYSGETYWTSTLVDMYISTADMWAINQFGGFAGYQMNGKVDGSFGVRPVINLKADVNFINDGSYDTPYEIVMN